MDAAVPRPPLVVVHRLRWRTVLLAVLALMLLAGLALSWTITGIELPPVHIVIDGVEHGDALNLAALPPAHQVLLALGALFIVVVALLVVPVLLLAAFGVALLVLLIGLGLPVIAVVAVGVVLASPMILVGLFVVWLLRRPARIRP